MPRTAFPALLCVLLSMVAATASAVTILDSTWRQEGGAKGKEWAGFGAAMALAGEPQFASVLALSSDGETWGEASATWIGNGEDGHAYLLTAAHIFSLPARADAYVVRTPGGRVVKADKVWLHPLWNGSLDTRTGYDVAILRTRAPITDAMPQPVLYAGNAEAGRLLTFVGFGSRGIGSTGQQDRFYRGSEKAAAQGTIDQVVPPAAPVPVGADGGNYLGVFLPKEDGSLKNPYGGGNRPATRLGGLLGSGDSGGSAWIRSADRWLLVGVNSNGSGTAAYGDTSWFTRISPLRSWISGIFPGARFAED
ncbi:MAG: trypsin-like serine protease [Actinomycetota bacterium]